MMMMMMMIEGWSAGVSRSGNLGHASPAGVRCLDLHHQHHHLHSSSSSSSSSSSPSSSSDHHDLHLHTIVTLTLHHPNDHHKHLLTSPFHQIHFIGHIIFFINLIIRLMISNCFTPLGNWNFTNVQSLWDQLQSFFRSFCFFIHAPQGLIGLRWQAKINGTYLKWVLLIAFIADRLKK